MAVIANLGTYYVVMCDYGLRGREAIVDPELTRGAIVQRIAHRDFAHDNVIAVHQVALGEPTVDITAEIFDEAGLRGADEAALPPAQAGDPHYAARLRRLAGVA